MDYGNFYLKVKEKKRKRKKKRYVAQQRVCLTKKEGFFLSLLSNKLMKGVFKQQNNQFIH